MPGHGDGAVLITGASAGIGRAFSHAFAQRGHDLVLMARREGPLQELADALVSAHGVSVTTIPADLSEPATPERLWQELAERQIEIGGLVNNAVGVPDALSEVDWARHRACLEVMAVAPVHLTKLFAPTMVRRGCGMIINVTSLSAFLPPHAGGGTLYYPVKSFLLQFSLAMREELRSGGVHVTALCPGFAAGGNGPEDYIPHLADFVARRNGV